MFIISLTYLRPLCEVDARLAEHNAFLDRRYRAGHFLLSGRKEPRTGGLIIAVARSKQEVLDVLEDDPFRIHGIASYEIQEFTPSRARDDLQHLLCQAAAETASR